MNPDTANAYPLEWPRGWPRAETRSRARFGKRTQAGFMLELSVAAATDRLQRQLDMLGSRDYVLSTNLRLRLDRLPRSDQAAPEDPGVALYFRLDGQPYCLACDRWDRVADNIAAIAAHLDAMRGQERWGVGSARQAFAGYKALPEPGAGKPWWEVLGVEQESPVDVIEAAWRERAKNSHPDRPGGNHADMVALNRALEEGRAATAP